MSTDRFTEILNYLSAMSREIGTFRSETRARFESLEAEVRSGFLRTHEDVRLLTEQVEVMTKDLMQVRGRQGLIDKRQREAEARLDSLEAK